MNKMPCSNTYYELQHDLESSREPMPEIDDIDAYKAARDSGVFDDLPPFPTEAEIAAHRARIEERAKEADKVMLRMFNRRSGV